MSASKNYICFNNFDNEQSIGQMNKTHTSLDSTAHKEHKNIFVSIE